MVTGSTGFIGRCLVARLAAAGWEVFTWPDDIRRIGQGRRKVEVVFHLAAVTRHERFVAEPYESYDINVTGTLAVLNYCQNIGAKCIFTSTSAVYDTATSDDQLTEEDPLKPTSPYGISKWIAENICRHQAVPVVILRLFNVYGPGQHPAFLIPYIVDCLQDRRPLILRMPQARRDFIYVKDVIDALIKAAHWPGSSCSVLNIGSGQATRIIDFVHLAEQIVGQTAVEIKTTGSNEGEVSAAIANIERAAHDLNWAPRYDVCAGLRALMGL